MDLDDSSRPDGDASNDEPVSRGASRFADVVVPPQEAKSWAAYRAVIHFSVDSAHLDHRHPWKTLKTRSSSGTGFYIGDRRIITNCHVIRDATSIRLTRNGQPGSFKGRVLCKSDMCDLALVTVDNESFWNGLPVVEFETDIPALGDAVIAVGYPLGAKAVSITRGVVSGISLSDLSMMNRNPRLMRIQIDAAINPGNSGGPVLNIDTKRVVGVAFSAISSAQSMSFIISNSVLNLFLKRYEANQRTEFGLLPESGFVCSELANQSMRQFYFRERYDDQNHFGCLIMYVERFTPAAELLCVGDVLISVDGCDVSDTGEVLFRGHEWLPYEYLVTSRSFGDSVRLQVLRRSESGSMSVIDIALPLVVPRPMLHKLEGVDFQPHWVIIGGLVFVRCCLPLLASMEKHETRAMNAGFGGAVIERKLPDEEIIVVADVLAHFVNIGCAQFKWRRLARFNGQPVLNLVSLAHVANSVLSVTAAPAYASEFIELDFQCFYTAERRAAIFTTSAVRESQSEILTTHRVPTWCSVELLSK